MKFHGKVGFWLGDKEVRDTGIFRPVIEERKYTGNIYRNSRLFKEVSDKANDDLAISNHISILSDLYLRENFTSIKYVEWQGVKLKVSKIEINYPRITLDVGGVYSGPIPDDSALYS